jgi:hypothetical protein
MSSLVSWLETKLHADSIVCGRSGEISLSEEKLQELAEQLMLDVEVLLIRSIVVGRILKMFATCSVLVFSWANGLQLATWYQRRGRRDQVQLPILAVCLVQCTLSDLFLFYFC